MPNDLYAPAASLLMGAGDTTGKTMAREQDASQHQDKIIANRTGERMQTERAAMGEAGADRRQQVLGQQQREAADAQLAGKLKEAEQTATLEKQKHDYEKFFSVTPELAQGLYKTSGGRLDFRDKIGSRQPTDLVMALATGYSRVESAGARGSGSGSGVSGADKEFLKTYRGYGKDTENWNYETIKALADTDPKQADDLKRKLDFIEANKQRFNNIQKTEVPVDKPATYSTADDVKAAFKAGKIDQPTALKVLKEQFNMGD